MPGFNVSNFRANGLFLGGARPSLFTVTLTFPDLVRAPGVEQKVQFTAKASSLPMSEITEIEVPYFGRNIKLAGERRFQDWTIDILNDEDFIVRNALEYWHNSINTIVSNRLNEAVANIVPNLGNSYKTSAIVTQFAKTGPGDIDGDGAIRTYRFDGLFPTSVTAMDLNWNDANRVSEFRVNFAYDWWEPFIAANDQPVFPTELNPA